MAQGRGHGDDRAMRGRMGQQAGSARPRSRGGTTRPAPKKGDMPHTGTRRMDAAPRGQPAKGGGMKPKR